MMGRLDSSATYSNIPETQGQALYSNTYSNYSSVAHVNRAARGASGSSPGPGGSFILQEV